jgi:lysophospholipase L1-like esterase
MCTNEKEGAFISRILVKNSLLLLLAGIAVAAWLGSALGDADAAFLSNLACWVAGAIPLVAVITHRKRIRWIWLFGPLSFLIFLTAIEIGLRYGPFEYRFLPMSVGKDFEPHPYLFWVRKTPQQSDRKAGDSVALNSEFYGGGSELRKGKKALARDVVSFRSGPVTKAKPAGVFRVVTMGGSNAEGFNIDEYADTFSAALELLLQDGFPGKRFEVISAGSGGYTLFQNLVLYKLFIREYSPDLIILYANINDGNDGYGPHSYREYFRLKTGIDVSEITPKILIKKRKKVNVTDLQEQFRKMHLYNFLVERIVDARNVSAGKHSMKQLNPLSDYRKNLLEFIDEIKKDKVNLILADAFSYRSYTGTNGINRHLIDVRGIMQEVALEKGVPFYSVHETISRMADPGQFIQLPKDDVHLNIKGHNLLAELLYSQTRELGFVDGKKQKAF